MDGNDIFLRSVPSDADNDDIRLRDPTVADSGGAINATANQTIAAIVQAATADLLIQATTSQTIDAVTQSVNADLLVQATAAQTIAAVTQSVNADLLIQATASQIIAAVTQIVTADVLIQATAAQIIAAFTQAATADVLINVTASQLIDAVTQAASAELIALASPELEITECRAGAGQRVRLERRWRGKYAGYFNDVEWTEWLLAAQSGDVEELPQPNTD